MNEALLLGLIFLPALLGCLCLLAPAKARRAQGAALLLGTASALALALFVVGRERSLSLPWGGWGIDFSLRIDPFSGFIVLSAAALSALVALYTVAFARGKSYAKPVYAGMLFTLALVNGAVMADNLAALLFFWEAILGTMFLMISAGGKNAHHTAVKALVIAGATDLCMMLGIGLAGHLAGTLSMGGIHLPITGWGAAAFALLSIGALSKAGAMPFHTWIPDAADDAPLPFMAFLPGALEKLLGVYLLARICLDLFQFAPGGAASIAMMSLGAGTILCAVMMALIQHDFKRLLSYHAVSQVGYMVLGIGTGLPVGIIGGLFHMLNNAVYKCCLYLTAGSVERQTGTTDLEKLGGLGRKMPLTFACFAVAAASIAGFPLTNGFFSKELILDGALESGLVFFIFAAVGAFFTPVSFLKLGHAVFLGKPTEAAKGAKESPAAMALPMAALAAACLALGIGQGWLVAHVLSPILGEGAEHVGGHLNWPLVGLSVSLLILAAIDHRRGFKRTGKGLQAADHFHRAPVLRSIYRLAERRAFDPYEVLRRPMRALAVASLRINDGISRFYDVWVPRATGGLSALLGRAHNGDQARYVTWVLGGLALTLALFLWP